MANYAYLRVSTDQQDLNNQRHGILEYANRLGLAGLKFVEDTASGKTNWKERKSGELLIKTMQKGDVIIFAEVSRMARSTLQVLEILEYASEHEYQVHIAKQNMRFDDSLNAKITASRRNTATEIQSFLFFMHFLLWGLCKYYKNSQRNSFALAVRLLCII